MPPGVGGVQPKLALSYSSQNTVNGPVGYGWALEGVSVITRCPSTREIDGIKAGVLYRPSDKLCLDGERLIPLRASDGAPLVGANTNDAAGLPSGAYMEYRTEKDSYARIRAYGYADGTNAAAGPQYFKIWTKAGLVLEYGDTPSKDTNTNALIRAYYPTTQSLHYAQLWATARVSDAFGNRMDFKYSQADTAWGSVGSFSMGHEWNIVEIQYSGNKVVFSYDVRGSSSPQDAAEAYNQGSKNLSINRLKAITTYVNSPNTTVLGPATGASPALAVKTLNLAYDPGPVTKRSRLTSIKECAGNAASQKCLPALAFEYSAGGDERYQSHSSFNLGGVLLNIDSAVAAYAADFNGDGRSDVLTVNGGGGALYFSNGDGTFTQASNFNINIPLYSGSSCDYAVLIVDFNADGLPDILRYSPDNKFGCPYGDGQSRQPDGPALYFNNGDGSFRTATLSGINLTDLMRADIQTGGASNTVFVSDGVAIYVLDVDGDGIPDIVKTTLFGTPGGGENGNVGLPLGSVYPQLGFTQVFKGSGNGGFSPIPTNIANVPIYSFDRSMLGLGHAFDVDGDGLTDILVSNSPNIPDSQVGLGGIIARSRGDGNFDLITPPTCAPSTSTGSCGAWALDHNGSGRSSLLFANDRGASNNKLYVGDGALGAVSQASNFNLTATGVDDFVPPGDYLLWTFQSGVLIDDFNGDGRHDILRWNNKNSNALYLSNGDGTFSQSTTFNMPGSWPQQSFGGSDGYNFTGSVLGDFTGSGNIEILATRSWFGGNLSSCCDAFNVLYVKANSELPDKLIRVKDGQGKQSIIRYANLAHPDFQGNTLGVRYKSDRNTANASTGAKVDVTQAMAVVVTTQDDNGVGGLLNTEYSYYGQKVHTNGRGDLGFRGIKKQVVAPNGEPLTTDTQYLQDFPYIGMPSNAAVYRSTLNAIAGGSLLSASTMVYCDQTAAAGVEASAIASGVSCASPSAPSSIIKRPYLLWSRTLGYDIDAARSALPTVTLQTSVNSTGDPTQVIASSTMTGVASDTYSKTTTNAYQPDDTACSDYQTCRWILGRMSQSSVHSTAPNTILATSAGSGPNASATSGNLAGQSATLTGGLAFGSLTVGQSATASAILTNTGVAVLSVTTPSAPSVAGSGFSFVSTTCSTSLQPGGECTVTVRFAPTAVGSPSGTLSVTTSAGSKTSSLTGVAVAPVVALTPGWINWGNVGAGSDSGDWYTLKNSSSVPVLLTSASVASGPAGVWAWSGDSTAGTCLFGTTVLAPGASCIAFFGTGALATVGTYSATSSINYQAQGVTATTFNVQQTYSFRISSSTVSPAALPFGNVAVSVTSAAQSITITNNAAESFDNLSVTKGGSNPANFNVTSNCGTTIAANASCTLSVTFSPTAVGTNYGGSIAVTGSYARYQSSGKTSIYGTPQSLASVNLSGVGLGSSATRTSASTLTVPAAWYGSAAQTVTATFRNDGNAPMTLASPALAAPLSVTSNSCSGIGVGQSCNMVVTAASNVPGLGQGQTFTPTGAAVAPAATTVTWTTYTAVPRWSSTTLAFGNVAPNTSSTQNITLYNDGNTAYNWATNGTIANAPTGYSFNTSACGNVVAGGNCSVGVTFTPTAIGTTYAGSGISMAAASFNTNTFSVNGVGAGSIASVQSNAVFGSAAYGAAISNQSISVKNTGNTPLALAVSGYSSPFSLVSNGCSSNVAPTASCAITFAMANNVIGSASQTISLTGATGGNVTATVSGTITGSAATRTSASTLTAPAAWYGSAARTVTATFSNDGNAPMTLASPALVAPLSVTSNSCSGIGVGQSCNMVVTAASNVPGLGQSQTFTPTGAAVAPAATTVTWTTYTAVPRWSSTMLDFGNLAPNTSSTQNITLYNDGNTAYNWATNGTIANAPAGYSFNTSACGNVVAGGNCTVNVTFTPTAIGTTYAGSGISMAAASFNTNTFSVNGVGAGSIASVQSNAVFGSAAYGAAISNQSISVKNTGNTPLALTVSGYSSPFSLVSNGCSSNVAPNASCAITFGIANNIIGSASQSITLSGATGGTATATVSGTILGSIAAVQSGAMFGSNSYGSTIDNAQVVVKNTGNATMTLTAGGYAAPFSHVSNACTNIATNSTCIVTVAMNSSVTPALYSQNLVLSGAAQTTGVPSLSGTILSVVPNFTPTSTLPFGSVVVGSTKTLSVSLRNDGSGSAHWTQLPGLPAGFTANMAACATVAPGSSCTVSITFAPTAVTTYGPASVSPTPASSVAAPLSVSGTGIGVVSLFTITLSSSAPDIATWTVKNNGTAAATLTALSTTLGAQVVVSNTTCPVGSSVAVGASCTVTTINGESCGGAIAYYLTATNSAGTAQGDQPAYVQNASCGGAITKPTAARNVGKEVAKLTRARRPSNDWNARRAA